MQPLWGCYAYMVTEEAVDAFVQGIRDDLTQLLWRGRRMPGGVFRAKPVDKSLPQLCAAAGLTITMATRPAFFRAPMLRSTIHTQYDALFVASTRAQLAGCGASFRNLWLTPEEEEAAAVVGEAERAAGAAAAVAAAAMREWME